MLAAAWRLGLVAACGSSGGQADSGPTVDGPLVDAPPPPTGPLSVTVLDAAGTPVVGATVVTHLATGEVLGVGSTGSGGTLTTVTVDGGMVTVGFAEPGGRRLVTAAGLAFGAAVTLRPRATPPAPVLSADINPPANPPANVAGYVAQIACRQGPQTSATGPSVAVNDDCVTGGTYAAAILALDAQAQLLGYSFAPAIPTATTSPALPAWSTDVSTFTVTLLSSPFPSCGQTCVALRTFRRTAAGMRFESAPVELPLTMGGGAALVIPHAGSLAAPETGVSFTLTYSTRLRAVVTRSYGGTPGNDTVDLATVVPTTIASLGTESTGSRLVVDWAAATGGASPAFVIAEIQWRAIDGDGGVEDRFWTVLSPPPGDERLTLPELPAELAAFAPELPADPGTYEVVLTLARDTAYPAYADFLSADWIAEVEATGPYRAGGRTRARMQRDTRIIP